MKKDKKLQDISLVADKKDENKTAFSSLDTKTEKKLTPKKVLKDFLSLLIYFAAFAFTITFCELFIRFIISGRISKINLTFLAFIPAEALFFTFFAGFFKKIGNKITLPILLFFINIYYCIQLVYFKIFGSLFSVSMMGMGTTAVGNFYWAMKEVIIASIVLLIVLLAPTIAGIVLIFIKKIKYPGYPILLHIIALALCIGSWFGGVLTLKMFGTDRQSAYYVLKNDSSDTDTTAVRLGAMTTFIVESKAYYFGSSNKSAAEELEAVKLEDLELVPDVVEDVKDEPKEKETVEKEIVTYDPWIDERFDFTQLAENATDYNSKVTYEYLAAKEPTYKNEYTGYFEGYNLIYICAESFWTYACNEKVTPTLYNMSHNGIVLTNYYNSFLNTTTNGEYAFATSLWPDISRYAMEGTDSGSFPQSSLKFMPYGVGDFFLNNGVETYGFHNYYGTYYRRNISWPNIGLKNTKYMGDMRFTATWPSSDLEMMEQSIDDYADNERFMAYYMTFSGHGPYTSANYMANKNIQEVKDILGDDADKYNDMALRYLACNLEFEKAMKCLLEALDRKGVLDKTVIVVASDHYPYFLEKEGRESLVGKEVSEMEQYHSTCIIYNSAIKEPIVNDEYCCNVDILPTILNLFNIPFDSRLLAGTDVFCNSKHTAVLYNKSFINDTVEYNAVTHEAKWKMDTSNYCEDALNSYLNNLMKLNDSNYKASVSMLQNNFFLTLWKQAGLLTPEEVNAEYARSQKAGEINEAQNEIDAEKERQRKEAEEAKAAAEAAQNANEN